LQFSDLASVFAIGISALTAAISIPLALRADRRSKVADIPVVNVSTRKTRHNGWTLLTFEVDNRTPGSWTIDTIEMQGRAETLFANGNWMNALADDWTPQRDHKVGTFPVGRIVKSGTVDTFHVYIQLTDQRMAVSASSRIGAPLLFQPITRLFSRRALRISSTKHAWSLERHVIKVPIRIEI
jgi:hypothetical protein